MAVVTVTVPVGQYLAGPPGSGPVQSDRAGTGDGRTQLAVLPAHGDTERLSIRAVAAEAQVTPSAMYHCLPGRRALVRTAVETCFDRFETELAQAEQGAAVPFEALRLRRLRHRPAAPVPRPGRRLVGRAQGAG